MEPQGRGIHLHAGPQTPGPTIRPLATGTPRSVEAHNRVIRLEVHPTAGPPIRVKGLAITTPVRGSGFDTRERYTIEGAPIRPSTIRPTRQARKRSPVK